MLVKYVNNEPTVNNPLGFIKSKLQLALQQYVVGDKISFSELQIASRSIGRKEVIPDWFYERNQSKEETVATVVTEEYQEKKRTLLKNLGKSPEEIEEEMNG
ncbi:MAG: hypothetical protein IMZ40_00495 [Bacilli bacterium]|nr:hypothetical protein [Bacilli bacterium]